MQMSTNEKNSRIKRSFKGVGSRAWAGVLSFLMAIILVLGLVACGGNEDADKTALGPMKNPNGMPAQNTFSDDEYGLDGAMFHYGLVCIKSVSTGKYGYKNKNNEWVIEPKFQQASPFYNHGFAYVKDTSGDDYYLIDRTGNRVGNWSFKNDAKPAKNGYIAGTVLDPQGVEHKSVYYTIDRAGEVTIYPFEYEAYEFQDSGYAAVYAYDADSNSTCLVIDSDLSIVVRMPQDYNVRVINNGIMTVDYIDGEGYVKSAYYDLTGKMILGDQLYGGLKAFDDKGYAVNNDCVIDRNMTVLVDLEAMGTIYKYIREDFRETDWVRVEGLRFQNADGEAYNFMNRQGEFLFKRHLYRGSGYSDVGGMRYGYFIGDMPYVREGDVSVIAQEEYDILQSDCSCGVMDSEGNLLYWTHELEIKNTEMNCADNYFWAERYSDDSDVVVDTVQGKIVVTGD